MLPVESPSRFSECVNRRRCSPHRLVGCNYLNPNIHIYTYTYLLSSCSVVSFGCDFCVFTCLCVCKYVCCFSILLRLSYFSVQDPGGPATFSTHARNNATGCVLASIAPQSCFCSGRRVRATVSAGGSFDRLSAFVLFCSAVVLLYCVVKYLPHPQPPSPPRKIKSFKI